MHTPQEPEYYLRRAFGGAGAQSGTPFIGEGGDLDSDLFIIYGHNMKNDTMFSTLDSYAQADFGKDNPTFTLTTITEEREYEIFAAIKTRMLYQEESGYHPLSKAGDLTEEEYAELAAWLKDNALYNTGITPPTESKSCCLPHAAITPTMAASLLWRGELWTKISKNTAQATLI